MSCCCCKTKFHFLDIHQNVEHSIPYLLDCNHSACKKCINKIVHNIISIKCNICKTKCVVPDNQQNYAFPVDFYLMGQILYNRITGYDKKSYKQVSSPKLDLCLGSNSIHKNDKFSDVCFECQKFASCICLQCNIKFCEKCFSELHNFLTLKNHCKISLGKDFGHYIKNNFICKKENCMKKKTAFCKTCAKDICTSCYFEAENPCKNHDIVNSKIKLNMMCNSLKNDKSNLEQILSYLKEIRNNFENMISKPDESLKLNIFEYFSAAHSVLRKAEVNLLCKLEQNINDNCNSDLEILLKDEKKLIKLLNTIDFFCSSDVEEMIDFNLIKEEIKNVYKMSWKIPETAAKKINFKVEVNEDILKNLENYCQIKDDLVTYNILTVSEILQRQDTDTDIKRDDFKTPSEIENDPIQNIGNKIWNVKKLKIGSVENVIITHINNPNEFYVQLQEFNSILENISSFLFSLDLGVPIKSKHVEIGNRYGYKNTKDNCFRVKLLKKSAKNVNHIYTIKYIDYGFTEDISDLDLYELQPQYKNIPSLAIKCSLSNCSAPVNGWTNNDNILMSTILKRKNATIRVEKFLADCIAVHLNVPSTMKSNSDISLRDVLLFHNATNINIKDDKTNKLIRAQNQQIRFKNPKILTSEDEVLIVNVISPHMFFVRKECSEPKFNKIVEGLNSFYSVDCDEGILYLPKLGLTVACFVENLQWCRGYIVDIQSKDAIMVYLVDYGLKKIVSWSALRYLEARFLKTCSLAIRCSLANIKPVIDDWSFEALQLLNKCSKNWNPLRIKVIRCNKDHVYDIFLYNQTDSKFITVNEELVQKGFAVSTRIENIEEIKITQLEDCISTKKIENNRFSLNEVNEEKVPVKILLVISPSEIYVTFQSHEEELKIMFEELQNHFCNVEPNLNISWNINDRCAVLSPSSNNWYRGLIKEIKNEGKTFVVFLKDIASFEEVGIANLRILPAKFLVVIDGAIKCFLTGIAPAMGNRWPNLTLQFLQDLVLDHKLFYLSKDGDIVNKGLPVKLWIQWKNMDDPLEPTIVEWKVVNDMIVHKGLAIRDNHVFIKDTDTTNEDIGNYTTTDKLSITTDDIILSNENEILSTKSEILLSSNEILSTKSEILLSSNEILSTKSEILLSSNDIVFDNNEVTLGVVKQYWKTATLCKKTFVGTPTYVDNDFNIYIIEDANKETLVYINKYIKKHYKDSKAQPEDMFWSENQPCIVQWSEDGQFYRGLTKRILENNNIEVFFVDYGNDELCTIELLRKNIVLDNIPILALKCKIVGIQLGGDNKNSILDYIHQIIVNNPCDVEVLGVNEEKDVYYIKLNVPVISNLGDHLVSKGYAKYCDFPVMIEITDLVVYADNYEDDSIIIDEEKDSSQNHERLDVRLEKENVTFTTDTDILDKYPKWTFLNIFLKCNVVQIISSNYVILKISLDNDMCSFIQKKLNVIFNDISSSWEDQPLIDVNLLNGSCIACDNNSWHRGQILHRISSSDRDESSIMFEINFIDLGYIKTVSRTYIRESKPLWLELPPITVATTLYGISLNDKVNLGNVLPQMTELFQGDLYAKVISESGDDYVVELFYNPGDTFPIYQDLIDEGLLVKVTNN